LASKIFLENKNSLQGLDALRHGMTGNLELCVLDNWALCGQREVSCIIHVSY